MHTRKEIIKAARLQDPEMGDEAIIAPMEWGYWVGTTIYVSKEDVDNVANARGER